MTRQPRAAVWAVFVAAMSVAAPVRSQTPAAATVAGAGRFELAAGPSVGRSVDLGGRGADLAPNLTGGPFTLFDASAQFRLPLGGEARFGYRVVPWLMASVSGSIVEGDVQVSLAHDAEGAKSAVFVGERLGQTQLEGRLEVLATRLRFWHARALPYVTASAGVVWQWHERNALVETGQTYQLGGGVRIRLAHRPRSRLSQVGVAGEVRLAHVRNGFHWGRDARTSPMVHVGVYTGWGR